MSDKPGLPGRDGSNAVELSAEEHAALIARFRADVGAYARWRSGRESHQAAERAAQRCAIPSNA